MRRYIYSTLLILLMILVLIVASIWRRELGLIAINILAFCGWLIVLLWEIDQYLKDK